MGEKQFISISWTHDTRKTVENILEQHEYTVIKMVMLSYKNPHPDLVDNSTPTGNHTDFVKLYQVKIVKLQKMIGYKITITLS